MDNIPTFESYINKITKKVSYLDKYGGSVIISCVTLLVFFILFSYLYVQNKILPIKADWLNQRCKPEVIPFAGMINAPPGVSAFEFTSENFMHCTQTILTSIIGMFLQPIYFMISIVSDLFKEIMNAVNMLRTVIAYIRNRIAMIVSDIFARIFNILIPIQVVLIKLKDILGKSVGVMTTGLYTILTLYLSMKSFLGAFLEILVLALIVLVAATVLLWILPFTWPLAGVLTALFTAVAIPLTIIAITLGDVLKISSSKNMPQKPGCFDKNTKIKLKSGEKTINKIKVNDVLEDGSRITATFKLSSAGQKMYTINNLVVSGSHTIYYNGKWVKVEDNPNAILIEHYCKPYIYCLNTTSKQIKIQEHLLSDWDDIDMLDFDKLKHLTGMAADAETNQIHASLEGGFGKKTQIELEDGRLINISDVKVNDILRFGDRVLGIVIIDAQHLNKISEYTFGNKTIIGGPNIWIDDNDLGKFSTLTKNSINVSGHSKLYHILTDTGYLTINGIRFMDYNSAIEEIMGDIWSEKIPFYNKNYL